MNDPEVVLMIHAGADPLPRAAMTPRREAESREALARALRAGHATLTEGGGSALDGVTAAIRSLEDSPLFNAGRGAAFDRDGRTTLDAATMEGKTRPGGAVAGLSRIRNPFLAARAVMERSGHALMQGEGADRFAEEVGLEVVAPDHDRAEERWETLQEKLREARASGPGIGTVGAVARDRAGSLAAGASTGGTTGKRPGRVGDTAVLGADVYAEDGACAVSRTGSRRRPGARAA